MIYYYMKKFLIKKLEKYGYDELEYTVYILELYNLQIIDSVTYC